MTELAGTGPAFRGAGAFDVRDDAWLCLNGSLSGPGAWGVGITGRIVSRQQQRGAYPEGVLGVPSGLVGDQLHPIQLGLKANPCFGELADVDMSWIGPIWPKCAFGDQKSLIWKEAMSFGKKMPIFNSTFHGSKRGILGPKTVFWGVLDKGFVL